MIVFAATILLPGLLLAIVGVRSLLQERSFTRQQLRERLERGADLAVRDLERELRDWQLALERITEQQEPDLARLPPVLRAVATEPGAGAVVFIGPNQRRVWPESHLLYDAGPMPSAADDVPNGLPADVESLELREKNYPGAAIAYRRLLATATSGQRAWLLLRLARTYRKAGRDDDAFERFRELQASTDRIGTLPASLIAVHETCSMLFAHRSTQAIGCASDLYRDLVAHRWRLEKSAYLFYADSAHGWLGSVDRAGPRPDLDRLQDIEHQKEALTAAVDRLFEGERGADLGTHVAIWRGNERRADAPKAALVLDTGWLAGRVWPQTFAAAARAGFDVRVAGASGATLFESERRQRSPADLTVARSVQDSPWRLEVWPRDVAALSADLNRRQTLYIGMLVLVMALLGFGTYLTARVVEKELEIARVKSEFVATVSHEFRSPLTGIRQLGELLMLGRVPSEARRQQYYERITRESDRLSRLVENLLDFARMEDGRKPYRFEPLDPSPWLRALVEEARAQVAERMDVVADIPDALPPLVADREALSCAMHNLIDNAVKYSPGRTAVWVEAAASNGGVTIRVRDHGVGIPDAERRRIFDKFYRGRDDITRQVKGAGLGLSLVQHIVAAHGGRVECESRPGDGTMFSVHLHAASPGGRA